MSAFDRLVSQILANQQTAELPERSDQILFEIIRDNFNTLYATQVASLAGFRERVSRHGGIEVVDTTTLLADFRAHVPLSNYDSYKPFIDKFNMQPCKEEDVENMFAPGLPDMFLVTSATTGTRPKVLPKYDYYAKYKIPVHPAFNPNNKDPLAAMTCAARRDVRMVARGEALDTIPVYFGSGAYLRKSFGWHNNDESWISLAASGYAAPWAATLITYGPSSKIVHTLFFLSHRNVYQFRASFATQFVDLIRHIDEHWDLCISCIEDGILPNLEGIDHLRGYLQAHFHPNPERAAELREIGRPSSLEGWFSRVWPNAKSLVTICSGQFATAIPKVRSILGPDVALRSSAYVASEVGVIGLPHDPNVLDEFVLHCDHVVEFLDVSLDAVHENICQAWQVAVGKQYEPILTTRDGLWRYRLDDILHIVEFHPESKYPIFKYVGRRSLAIHTSTMQITGERLLAAIQATSSKDGIQVHEFTAVLDHRASPPTVGFFIEPVGPLGPNAHLARQKIHDALTAENSKDPLALQLGKIPLPTIRIVRAGTFAEYRQWKNANVASVQTKVPVVLADPAAQEWILGRAVQEL